MGLRLSAGAQGLSGCPLQAGVSPPPLPLPITITSNHPFRLPPALLLFHPAQNPDPKAAAYFASYISKAYAALTDEVSRQNYDKYGHPDGPQVSA